MCGRYSLTRREAELIERFGIEQLLAQKEQLKPRYNIAPTQMVPVVLNQEGKRALAEFKWGLIPFWTKDLKKAKPIINARSETMAEKPFFKQALIKRRCLIPADGFYEWKKQNKEKIPMYIHFKDRELFAFAGLWDEWTSSDGEVLRTCTIITTEANDTMSPVHDRMPVIVRPEYESLWLSPDVKDPEKLQTISNDVPNDDLQMYPVSSIVNSAMRDLPDMVQPCAEPVQGLLWDQPK